MASPAQRLSLGPWPEGLVLLSENSQLDASNDAQFLTKCINLDITNEGYLSSRAGCQRVGTIAEHYTDANRTCRVLGSIFENGDYQAVLGIVIGSTTKIYLTADGYTLQYWGTVAQPLSSVQQYVNTIYLIRSDTGTMVTGGYTIPNNFFTNGVPNVATASVIPSGDTTFIFKERLFIVNKATSTIYFSAPTDPADYAVETGGGFFIVNPSNDIGTSIFDVSLSNETFYIFKRNSTYLFAYDINPNVDGVLRLINTAIGGFSSTVWENDVYVVNIQGVYRVVNGVFIRLDTALDLQRNADLANIIADDNVSSHLFIHAAANKLLVGYFSSEVRTQFGFDYVSMNLTNGAWSGYKFESDTAAPGDVGTVAQKSNTWGMVIYPSKTREYFVRIPSMRGATDYNLDAQSSDGTEARYFPPFIAKFPSYSAGVSSIWKKLHRFFIRGRWTNVSGGIIPDVFVDVIYDNNLNSQQTVTWGPTSSWEISRPQTEFKLPLKQHRFRNLSIELNNDIYTDFGYSDTYEIPYVDLEVSGYSDQYTDLYYGGSTVYAVPPNSTKELPDNEFYLTNLDVDISVPRGMSTV